MQLNQAALRLKKFSHTATIRNSIISFSGTAINGLLGIIYFFYLSTRLRPDEFGRFTITIGIIAVGYSIFNFGLDQSIKKFKSDNVIIANIISIKLIISIFLTLVPLIFFRQNTIYSLIGIGIASQLLFSMSTTFLQSWQKYMSWSLYMILTNLIRLMVSVYVPFSDILSHLIVYILMPLLGFFIFYILNKSLLPKLEIQFDSLKKLFMFNAPLTGSSVISAIISKLDTFFIAGFQNFSSAGIYSLITQISSSVSQLASAYSAVISPVFSSLDTPQKNTSYLRKNMALSIIISILLIPILLISGYYLFYFSGKDFSTAFLPLVFLTLGMAVFFASVPLFDSRLYYHGDSKIYFKISIVRLFYSILSGIFIIKNYGSLGASVSFLILQIISVIMIINRHAPKNSRTYHN